MQDYGMIFPVQMMVSVRGLSFQKKDETGKLIHPGSVEKKITWI